MAKMPSEILRKRKEVSSKVSTYKQGDDKHDDNRSGNDKDNKKVKRNGLLDFIAKHKKVAA